jgi:FkbM family methyltransferase
VGIAAAVMDRIPVRLLIPSIAWQYRLFEPELSRLDEFVPADRGAVDVGAWWGPWTWWLARRTSRVDSFEPNAQLADRLTAVMPPNVTVHPMALTDKVGHSDLWVPPGGAGSEGRSSLSAGTHPGSAWSRQSVVTGRLDDFAFGDVGFIKIDVEGQELAVLTGASGLLDAQRPTVMVEVEQHPDRQGSLDAVVEFFEDRSYRGTFLHHGRWHPIDRLDRAATQRMAPQVAKHGYAVNLLLYARRYVNNFVFTPR